jgi:hypothetical protein
MRLALLLMGLLTMSGSVAAARPMRAQTVRCVLDCRDGSCRRVCRPVKSPPVLPASSRTVAQG